MNNFSSNYNKKNKSKPKSKCSCGICCIIILLLTISATIFLMEFDLEAHYGHREKTSLTQKIFDNSSPQEGLEEPNVIYYEY